MVTCPYCAEDIQQGLDVCPFCQSDLVDLEDSQPPHEDIGTNAGMRLLLPVGRSGWAIAAGYAGLFSLTCFLAPIAVILGVIAIYDIKKHSDRHGMGRAIFGIVMGILGTLGLVFGIFGW